MNRIRPNTTPISTLTRRILEPVIRVIVQDIRDDCRGVEECDGGIGMGVAELRGVGLEMGVPGVDAGVEGRLGT